VDKIFSDYERVVVPAPVDSGVSAQPVSARETIAGARARALASLKAVNDADYGIGLEGGIEEIDGIWYECGWIVVASRNGKVGIGSSARYVVSQYVLHVCLLLVYPLSLSAATNQFDVFTDELWMN
jgi:non-canonical (house-cleaning) NTP pyrophosphatase